MKYKTANSAAIADDTGSAVIEFLFFSVAASTALLLVGLNLAELQHRQLVVTSMARQIVRQAVHQSNGNITSKYLAQLGATFGVNPAETDVAITCLPACEMGEILPGAIITAMVSYRDASFSSTMRNLR